MVLGKFEKDPRTTKSNLKVLGGITWKQRKPSPVFNSISDFFCISTFSFYKFHRNRKKLKAIVPTIIAKTDISFTSMSDG